MLKTWRNGAEGYITFEMGEFGVETKQINESKTNHKKKKGNETKRVSGNRTTGPKPKKRNPDMYILRDATNEK